MTIKEYENENYFLRNHVKKLSEQIAELNTELLFLKTDKEKELEPRYYFNSLIDDFSDLEEEDRVSKLIEISDYLDGYIGNHSIEGRGRISFDEE